jgi:hypothetical protein
MEAEAESKRLGGVGEIGLAGGFALSLLRGGPSFAVLFLAGAHRKRCESHQKDLLRGLLVIVCHYA